MKQMEERGKKVNLKNLLRFLMVTILAAIFAVTSYLVLREPNKELTAFNQEGELARAMTYEQFLDGEENIEGTDNVKFSAFFLRDLDGDGYAEKIKGTCKELGSEDTMYMEIIVQTGGYLKDGKIQVDGKNFFLKTALPKDNELKDNYIGNDVKAIEFNKLYNGTQKMITGTVCSGNYTYSSQKYLAIGNNINNYSRNDNKIILTGIYVDDEGNEVPVEKEITLNMDWYGTTRARLNSKYKYQTNYNLQNVIDEENGRINLSFSINTEEFQNELLLSSTSVTATIPDLNGYSPIEVTCPNSGVTFDYYSWSKSLTISKTATLDGQGNINNGVPRSNSYTINVSYPIEAFDKETMDIITLNIPVEVYYMGYNNKNSEFISPYKSNIAKDTIVATYRETLPPAGKTAKVGITVGDYIAKPTQRYIVRKEKPLKIYNGVSSTEINDRYQVVWSAYTGTLEDYSSIVLSENGNVDTFIKNDGTTDSMENLVTNVGMYFESILGALNEDGWLKVYDVETNNLLLELDKTTFGKYTKASPFYFAESVKHLRIETSALNRDSNLKIVFIKELDDEYITDYYSREEFDLLSYIKSTLQVQFGEKTPVTVTHQAKYEEAFSIANISIDKSTISTQKTEENVNITISATEDLSYNQVGWLNGTYLVKLPKDILKVNLNDVEVDHYDVVITSSEIIETEDGIFIKINTSNSYATSYSIRINTDLTPNPVKPTSTQSVMLYATNEESSSYYYNGADIYDVDDDGNVSERVNSRNTSIRMVSPNSLLTNQILGEFDEIGTVLLSPEIAELKQIQEGEGREKQTVRIGVQLKNNYASAVSDLLVLGKIPFEGNTYVVSGKDLKSEFTTSMKNTGLIVPDELKNIVTVYYSENENPTQDRLLQDNGWKLKEEVTNWDNIKTFLIDFGGLVMNPGNEYTFFYDVDIPFGVDLNKVAYSHHGIFFSLNTNEGKYRTKTEPNKIGIKISEKYVLELNKYQIEKDKKVANATYSISELDENGDIIQTKTARTNDDGKILIDNLYAEKMYTVQEIKSPGDYELNNDIVSFTTHYNEENSTLTAELIYGNTRGELQVTKLDDGDNKVILNVEDEAKAKIKIIKTDTLTNEPIKNVKYVLSSSNSSENDKISSTNALGQATFSGLTIGQIYHIKEKKATGYYIEDDIGFRVVNDNGVYQIEFTDNESIVKNYVVQEEDSLPVVLIELEDEKVPTYDLEITKIKKETQVIATTEEIVSNNVDNITYISGAKFRLYKGGKELGTYVSDENGKITINNLYQYNENRNNVDQTYLLKEIFAPEGYVTAKEISFKVQNNNGQLEFVETDGEKSVNQYITEGNKVKIIIEDEPIFKLTKKDGETGELLANTKFAIYNMDAINEPAKNSKGEVIGEKVNIEGKDYYVVTTDANGEITLDLPQGFYKAVEVQASDEKYDLTGQKYYFGIGKSRDGEYKYLSDWSNRFGNNSNDIINSAINTEDDGFIIAGAVSGGITTGNEETIPGKGGSDGIVVKYTPDKEVEWADIIGGSSSDAALGVVETNDNEFIVYGTFSSTITLTNGQKYISRGGIDGFVIKYNQIGEIVWSKQIGGTGNDYITSIIKTSEEDYIVGGYTNASIDFENGNEISVLNGVDSFIVKYDQSFNPIWARTISGTGTQQLRGITDTDTEGCVAIVIYNRGQVTLEANGEPKVYENNSSSNYGLIIKYSSDGDIEWSRGMKVSSGTFSLDSIIRNSDNEYIVVGRQEKTLSFNENDLTFGADNYLGVYACIFAYSEDGEMLRNCFRRTNTYTFEMSGITQLNNGNYLISGNYTNTGIDFGNGVSIGNSGSYGAAFVIEFTKEFKAIWAKTIGIGNSSSPYRDGKKAIKLDDNNYILVGKVGNSQIALDDGNSIQGYGGYVININKQDVPVARFSRAISEGGTTSDYGYCGIKTSDGGLLTGSSFNRGTGVIIKYNKDLEKEWRVNKGTYIERVAETKDGYLAASFNGYIYKLNYDGTEQWNKSMNAYIYSLIATKDEGFAVCGYFTSSVVVIDGQTINNVGQKDGFIAKFNKSHKLEWIKVVGGEKDDYMYTLVELDNGDIVAGGSFAGRIIFENGEMGVSNGTHSNSDALILRYSHEGVFKNYRYFGGPNSDCVNEIVDIHDGGYAVACQTPYSFSIDGRGFATRGNMEGFVARFDENDRLVWGKTIGGTSHDNLQSILFNSKGNIVVAGYTESAGVDVGPGIVITGSRNDETPIVIEYDIEGNALWAVAATSPFRDGDYYQIVERDEDDYIIIGHGSTPNYNAGSVNLDGDNTVCEIRGYTDSLVLEVQVSTGIEQATELLVENKVKEYRITTEVKEINGVKGGTISGEEENPYEIVRYGESSNKEIKIIPNPGYEIVRVTINGNDYNYTTDDNGICTMERFDNVVENKHVIVTFAAKDNKIILNKVDSKTGEMINSSNATFKIEQVDERPEPVDDSCIGDIEDNGALYYRVDKETNVEDVIGDIEENGTYYFVKEVDNEGNISYIPTNSKTWQVANVDGATKGVQNSTAQSYIPIDLTGKQGYYKVYLNAMYSTQIYNDYGFARITEDTNPLPYNNSTARFAFYSGGRVDTEMEAPVILEGGKTYYLHLGYYKNSGTDTDQDLVRFSNIRVCPAEQEHFNFDEVDGKYISTNQGRDDRVANSYIPIDLTNYPGKYTLRVNAEITSDIGDLGYMTITDNTDRPEYSSAAGRFMCITGVQPARDYETVLDGGNLYYLHLGYYKNESVSAENDNFTINSISLLLNNSDLYRTTVETNSEGKAITQIPFGKYAITELKAPDGYKINNIPVVIEFNPDDEHEFNIENDKIRNVIVHHYIKDSDGTYTTDKVADDETLNGLEGESYITYPVLDAPEYELEKDDTGEYIMPDNYTGEYGENPIEVTYYYTKRGALLTVNHLIEGTTNPVVLSTGEEATPQTSSGEEGKPYTTNALSENEIAEKYELVADEMPDNAEGTYEYDEVIVNYYYRVKRFNITTEVEEYEKVNMLGETEIVRGGSISGDGMEPYEVVEYDEDSQNSIIVRPSRGYEIRSLTINDEPYDYGTNNTGRLTLPYFNNVKQDMKVVVSFQRAASQVIVHHYIEGTEDKVPSIYGGEVEDEIKNGSIGDPYATKPTDEISGRYEVVNNPENASGTFDGNVIEVTYYYREVPAKVITNHLINGTTDPVPLSDGNNAEPITENGYVTKPYTTEPLTSIDDGYVLVGDSGNTTGNMTKEDTIVNYYYAPKAYAKVNYIAEDWDGNYETLETIDYEGYDGEVYTSHSKDFTGYTLTDVPEHETYPLSKDAVTVFNYYYKKNPVSVSLVEKHIDLYTGEIIYSKEHEDALTGDSYEINRQVFDGYKIATNKKYYEKLVKDNPEILSTNSVETVDELLEALGLNGNDPYIPKNYKGVLRNEPVEVVYYYVKEAKVIVEYHDINGDDPTNPIHPDDIVPGLEKDPYKVEPVDIDGYDLVTDPDYTPTNTEGEMDRDDIIVKYYYEYKTDVVVNHIDISNESKIDSDKKEGHEKDLYKMDQMDLAEHPNYRIVTNQEYYEWLVGKDSSILEENGVTTVGELLAKLELGALDPYIPANYKGEMTKDEIVVNYYYKKQAKVTVKHIDEATGTVLKTEEATYDVGDTYTTGPETIENYTLNEDKLPGNATGEVKEGGVEVKYYYNKKTTPVTPDPGGNTPTPEPDPDPTQQPSPNPTPEPGPGPAPAPQSQPSSPAPQSPVVTTAKKIYNKVLPRTGDTTIQTATSIIVMVILLNMLVTDKVNQGPRNETKVEKDKKKKVKGKRFK